MIDETFQDSVLACMQKVPEFNAVCVQYLDSELFDGVVRKNLAKMMMDFWVTYDTLVTDRVLVSLLKDLVASGRLDKHDVMPHAKKYRELVEISIKEWKYVLDKLIDFIKHQKIKALIERSVTKLLPGGKYADIENEMAKISSISTMNKVQPYDYFDMAAITDRAETRERELKEGKVSISTGIPELDEKLHARGFYKKELYIFAASPKRGKTMSLLWFGNQGALQGYNIAHFTCEVSREICSLRLDAMNSKTRIHDVAGRNDIVASHVKSKIPRGKLMLFEYPTKSLTPQMAAQQLERLRTEHGIVTHMAIFDYLDIMKHQGKNSNDANWSSQGPIAEELRRIAGEFSIPVVTATQINRKGSDKPVTGGSDVAGDYEKIMIADEIFTLSATKDELKEQTLRINNSESRNSESGTIVINTNFGYGQFYNGTVGLEL